MAKINGRWSTIVRTNGANDRCFSNSGRSGTDIKIRSMQDGVLCVLHEGVDGLREGGHEENN